MEKFHDSYIVGIHEEKLNALEEGQDKLAKEIKGLKLEVKENIDHLISALKENSELQFKSFDKRLSRVEGVLLWAASGLIATLFAFMWSQVNR